LVENLFDAIPDDLPEELTETLLTCREVRVERIVSRGHFSPPGFWFDQEENEWILLLSGSAVISYDGSSREVTLKPGDYLNIPAHTRHRVERTDLEGETVWLAIFYS
jgi:cupin 2 domain-containing protein